MEGEEGDWKGREGKRGRSVKKRGGEGGVCVV